MSFKTQYKRVSLIVIVLLLGLIIFSEMRSFLSGILGAMTIYILLRKQLKYLTEKKRIKKGVAAALLLGETILVFLIPLAMFTNIVIELLNNNQFDPQDFVAPLHEWSDYVRKETGYDILKSENISSTIQLIPKIGQFLMNEITGFMVNIFILIFVLYFILVDSERIEKYIYDLLPFSEPDKKEVLHEVNMIVTSNAIGIPLLAVIQGAIAMVGYLIFVCLTYYCLAF